MSGSNSSVPDSRPEPAEGLSLTVHTLPNLAPERRRLSGRLQMLLVLAVCAAPVIASYFTYYVVRPGGRTNYGELIDPQRTLPALPLQRLTGEAVPASSLKGQWLLVAVAGGACDAACEKTLYLQRQLRETLGREKERVDKVWLIPDGAAPRPEVLAAINPKGAEATVLRVPAEALAGWLQPAAGQALADHFYVVDPMGNWMMRFPADPQPAKVKRDLEKLLRASSSWDKAGR
ncbi:MAG: SCO family protein [Rhizobacter sp.]|jgi:hypothetical protein